MAECRADLSKNVAEAVGSGWEDFGNGCNEDEKILQNKRR